MVRDEFHMFLHSKLAAEDFNNPTAREEALEEQANWFWEHHDALIDESITKGKGTKVVRKLLRPIIQMVSGTYCSHCVF